MKSNSSNLLYLSTALLVAGCAALPALNPVTNEIRTVVEAAETGKEIVLQDSQVWYDGPMKRVGIMLPKGTYELEAEDEEYLYFEAPNKIEFRHFGDGAPREEFVHGGIFLAKRTLNLVPAGAYEIQDEQSVILRWKLGSQFLGMEGRKWKKNY